MAGENLMKFNLLCLLALTSTFSWAETKIIYGEDNRVELSSVADGRIRALGQAIAGRVPNMNIEFLDDKTFSIETMYMDDPWGANLCSGEKFRKQPSASDCTGFLVGEDLLVTAGHCVLAFGETAKNRKTQGCQSNSWLFDYSVNSNGQL